MINDEQHHSLTQHDHEARYQALMESLDVSLCCWLPDTRLVFANAKYRQLFGIQGDYAEQKWLDVLPATQRAETIEFYQELLKNPRTVTTDYSVKMADGSEQEYQWITSPIFDKQGKLKEFQSVGIEISERKRAEEKLKRSEKNLRTFFESMDDMVFVVDLQGQVLHVNSAVNRNLGYTLAEAIGMNVLDFHLPEQREEAQQIVADMLSKRREACPLPLMLKNGMSLPVETRVWFGEWDGNACIFGLSKDLSKQQAALQKFDKLFQNNPLPMAVSLLPERNFVDVNAAFLRKLGYRKEEVIGNTAAQLKLFVHPEQNEFVAQELQRTGRIQNYLLEVRHKSGSIISGLFFGEVIESQGQRYFLTLMADVTGEPLLNQALRESHERYSSILRAALDGFLRTDMAGNLLEVNAACCNMSGYSEAELLSMNIVELDANMDEAGSTAMLQKLVAEGGVRFETRHRHKNGSFFDVEANIQYKAEEGGYTVAFLKDITARKQAEQAMKASEQRFHTYIEQATDAIFVTHGSTGQFTEVNQQACLDLGYSRAELLTKSVSYINKGVTDAQVRSIWQQVKPNEPPLTISARHQRKDGSSFPVEVRLGCFDLEGERYYLGVARNMTERLQAEEQLRASENRYRTILNTVPDLLFEVDCNGIFLSYSTPDESMLYVPPNQFLGKSVNEVLPPRIATMTLNKIKACIEKSGLVQFEYELTMPSGVQYFEARLMPLSDTTVLSVVRDVTEAKRAEQQIQKQLQRISALNEIERAIASSMDMRLSLNLLLREACGQLDIDAAAVLLFNEQHNHLEYFSHQGFRTLLIRNSRIALGEGFAGVVGAEQKIHYIPDINAVDLDCIRKELFAAEGIEAYFGAPLLAKGSLKGVLELFNRSPIHFDNESLHYLETLAGQAAIAIENAMLFKHLQTANAELEKRVQERTRELQLANLELAQADRAKTDFLANMSHELRTPLSSILGLAESMQEGVVGAVTEHQMRYLQTIQLSGHHLLELINDILDLSKIEVGKLELESQLIKVDDICQSSLMFLKEPALKKAIELVFSCEPASFQLFADARRLKQILINLLSNAVKFSPTQSQVTLKVYADTQEDRVIFSVQDQGIGIRAEHLNKLFTPFTQIDSGLNRQYEGTGLGLALVKKLTDMHGGSVTVESEIDQGSRFIVTLPWHQDLINRKTTAVTSATLTAMPPTKRVLQDKRILLAEDNSLNAQIIENYLRSQGYVVKVARHGGEAVLLAETFAPHLILMDVQMPIMNGLEATQKIRQLAALQDTPIIALTALAMPSDREQCIQAGMNGYLSKPASLKGLSKLIAEFIG